MGYENPRSLSRAIGTNLSFCSLHHMIFTCHASLTLDLLVNPNWGPRGDCILQLDWCVGELVDFVETMGLTKNTLFVFVSDNGPVMDDGYKDQALEQLGNHRAAGPLKVASTPSMREVPERPLLLRGRALSLLGYQTKW